jgi:hypothetical protein
MGMSSDSLQEAAPGSVHQVLLVGKMPDAVPSGLQVLSQIDWGGGGVLLHLVLLHDTFFS